MKQERINPGWAWPDKYKFPPAIKLGDTITTSGLVPFDSDGNIIGDDMYSQATKTFANIKELLEYAGGSMADVVKVTAFLTDMSLYGDYAKARTEAFPAGIPATAVYATPALALPGLLVEIEVVAVLGSGS